MAREYALVGTGIWSEPSILALTPLEQHAYLLVHTQPQLSRCGVAPYTLRRWAGLSRTYNATKLRAALRGLEHGRHLVIDEDTEEVLVRTYVRHDGLLKQPQVVGAMVRDYRTIRSSSIRTAFLAELRRIWHLTLDEKERGGLSLAFGVTETDKQKEVIGDGLGPPLAEAIQQGLVEPFTAPLPQGLPEALGKALARRSYPCPYPGPNASPEDRERDLEVEVDVPRARPA